MAGQQSSAGARAGSALSAAQGYQNAQAQKKKDAADYKAKKERQDARNKVIEQNTGGLYQQWIGTTTGGAFGADGKPLALTGRLIYQGKEVTANQLLNNFFAWTPAEVNAFDNKIKSLQIRPSDKPIDPDDRRDIYVSAVARASQFYALTKGENKIDGSLEGTLLAYKGVGAGGSGAANLPRRNIENIGDATINAIIDKISQSKLQKDITDPIQRAALVKSIKEKIAQGTLTTTKKIKNPVTGKMEEVTQTTGPTSEEIQLQLGKDLETSNAQDFELSKRLEFHSELDKIFARSA